jgi:hypothetical protein
MKAFARLDYLRWDWKEVQPTEELRECASSMMSEIRVQGLLRIYIVDT